MAIYDFVCADCGSQREVLADYESKQGLELLCIRCGGVMKAAPVNGFSVITHPREKSSNDQPTLKPCGHFRHCNCASAIKRTKPNPFQKEIDKALMGIDNRRVDISAE